MLLSVLGFRDVENCSSGNVNTRGLLHKVRRSYKAVLNAIDPVAFQTSLPLLFTLVISFAKLTLTWI